MWLHPFFVFFLLTINQPLRITLKWSFYNSSIYLHMHNKHTLSDSICVHHHNKSAKVHRTHLPPLLIYICIQLYTPFQSKPITTTICDHRRSAIQKKKTHVNDCCARLAYLYSYSHHVCCCVDSLISAQDTRNALP